MALFRVQVHYQAGEGAKWSNVYHITASDGATALAAADTVLANGLTSILHPACRIVKVLVTDLVAHTFFERVLQRAGTNGDTDSLMPFFNAAKVLFGTDAGGRPDYKYFKGLLTDDANASGQLESSVIAHLEDILSTLLTDMEDNSTPLVADDSAAWTSIAVDPTIAMRQLHRRRRRTVVTP